MTALPIGQYVKHYRYGFGVITESDDEGTSIEFEASGTKKFVTKLLVVELSDLTPPERFRAKWVKTASALPAPHKGFAARPRKRFVRRPPQDQANVKTKQQ